MSNAKSTRCAPGASPLAQRVLFSVAEAGRLKAIFKILANEHRLRLLHALERSGELCVTELADAVDMSSQAVSGQLQRLVDRGIVSARRDGNFVYYRIVDPCVIGLMDLGICLVEETEGKTGTRSTGQLTGPTRGTSRSLQVSPPAASVRSTARTRRAGDRSGPKPSRARRASAR
jgi:DNA-binding transcriptional ArsR family regulator